MSKQTTLIHHRDKYGHEWLFHYEDGDEQQRIKLLRKLGLFAAHPELTFDWFDAAIVAKRVRETARVITQNGRVSNGQPNI